MEAPRLVTAESEIPASTEKYDATVDALAELFFIEHPEISKRDAKSAPLARAFAVQADVGGIWVYYPWAKKAIRIPDEATYFKLRTARNRNLITDGEQAAYRAAKVGIAGLSVGSAAALMLAATGGPQTMRLADPDTIEITNLNRMRAALPDVGANKAEVVARLIWEIDPFAKLEVVSNGVTQETLAAFVSGLTVFVDEMDDIALKFAAREASRAARVPVVMATDNGDGMILDVERFDQEPERAIFHGRVSISSTNLADLSREGFVKLSNEIIDAALFSPRQSSSVGEVGKTLSGIPQLGTAAAIAGAAVAYAVRQIAVGAPLSSGRYLLDLKRATASTSA